MAAYRRSRSDKCDGYLVIAGPSAQELAEAEGIKKNIAEQLKTAIHVLQQDYIQNREAICSGDIANGVCCVLEAVFLHGLKPHFATKCFWHLLKSVTHKDMVAQLNHLGQITTQVGMCRAWIRLALNDSVLESYLSAILADDPMLRQNYRRLAFLRDQEQGGILMTYIQGLLGLEFQLSYNSSLLNIWTGTPLILAGLDDEHYTPPATINSRGRQSVHVAPSLPDPAPVIASSTRHEPRPRRKKRGASRHVDPSGLRIGGRQEATMGLAPPPGTSPQDTSQLTKQDIDNIRRMTLIRQQRSEEDAASTATSQISHPDPTDARTNFVLPFVSEACPSHPPLLPVAASSPLRDTAVLERNSPSLSEIHTGESSVCSTSPALTALTDTQSVSSQESKQVEHTAVVNNNDSSKQYDSVEAQSAHVISSTPPSQPAEIEVSHSSEEADVARPPRMVITHPWDVLREEKRHSEQQVTAVNASEIVTNNGLSCSSAEDRPAISASKPSECETVEEDLSITSGPSRCDTANMKRDSMDEKSQCETMCDKKSRLSLLFPRLSQPGPVQDSTTSGDLAVSSECPSQSQRSVIQDDYKSSNQGQIESETTRNGKVDCKPVSPSEQIPQARRAHRASLSDVPIFTKMMAKSPPLEPELSSAQTGRVEVSDISQEVKSELMDSFQGEEICASSGSTVQGNSLGMMEGWSSEFDPETSDSRDPPDETPDSPPNIEKSLEALEELNLSLTGVEADESFNQLLENYGPRVTSVEGPMSQLLDELPEPEPRSVHSNSSTHTTQPSTLPTGDEAYEEYDVLSDVGDTAMNLDDPREAQFREVIGELTTERGLDFQNYQCKGCGRPIGMIYGKARVCSYDSSYYCYECHENDEYYIPARIAQNWDFRKHKVSRHSLSFLKKTEEDAMIDLQKANARLYVHVPCMRDVQELRQQLRMLRAYLFTCKQSIADDLRRQVWPREHLYEYVHMYSLADLLQVPNGTLAQTIRRLIKFSANHVYNCRLCSQKGFICEVCDNPKVIYPFEMDTTFKCQECQAVYHKACLSLGGPCPRCSRRQKRRSLLDDDSDSADYAISPDSGFVVSGDVSSSS